MLKSKARAATRLELAVLDWSIRVSFGAVSYTHLTLPTIYSV